MFISFQSMFLMTQKLCFPRVHDGELDGVEMVSDLQHRMQDVGRDAVEQNETLATTSAMEENDIELIPREELVPEQRQGGVSGPQFDISPCVNDALARAPTTDIERNGSSRSEFMRPPAVVEPGRPEVLDEVHAPNIIIFGEAGVGKSSIINLIAGHKRAHISNDALGCTFQYQRHTITLDGIPFAFWDTTGLDEGSEGTVPAKLAENNLRMLIQGLAHSGGIHLVIYCIRGTRLTKALKHNYDLFYAAVCRKKVPVALVVTGLEHQSGSMETWWDENQVALRRCGMWFSAHACVTTLEVDDAVIQGRRLDSRKRLHDLVIEYSARRPWKIEPSLISWTTFRNILRGVSSFGKKVTRRVVICDRTTTCRAHKRSLGDRQLEHELVYVDNPHAPSASDTSAGVLVFYTSPQRGTRISPEDVDALRTFYNAAGGDKCPVIVVLRGCKDDQIVRRCWDAIASDIDACLVVDDQVKLDAMIEKRCIEHVEDKSSRLHKAYTILMEWFATVVRWQDWL